MKRLFLLLPLFCLIGCASTVPTAFERTFATVETNYVPILVLHTNIVTQVQTNVQTVTVTNQIGVAVPVFTTNLVTVQQTNVTAVTVTNEQYVLTPNGTAKAVAGGLGMAGNMVAPGFGGLVTSGVLGLLTLWFGYRNRQFAGKNDALTQSAGVLAQIIETGREVLATTPQGKDASNAFTSWMVSHQAETDTIATITKLVRDNVDNGEAQNAARKILELINKT